MKPILLISLIFLTHSLAFAGTNSTFNTFLSSSELECTNIPNPHEEYDEFRYNTIEEQLQLAKDYEITELISNEPNLSKYNTLLAASSNRNFDQVFSFSNATSIKKIVDNIFEIRSSNPYLANDPQLLRLNKAEGILASRNLVRISNSYFYLNERENAFYTITKTSSCGYGSCSVSFRLFKCQ